MTENEELRVITKALIVLTTVQAAQAVMPNMTEGEVEDMRELLREMLFGEADDPSKGAI